MRQLQAGNISVLKIAFSVRIAKHGTHDGHHRDRNSRRVCKLAAQTRIHIGNCKRIDRSDRRDETACSHDLLDRLHIDVEGFQKF
jgi:hypothetical protein